MTTADRPSTSPLPSIGVLINVWGSDQADPFEESLRSILNQTRQATELFVVADGPLNTEVESVISRYQDHITELLRHREPLGLAQGRNTGLKAMRSDFVALQDADDISHPKRIETLSRALGDSSIIPVVTSSPMVEFASETREVLSVRPGPRNDQPLTEQLRRLNPINHPTVVLHRSSFMEHGPYYPLHKLEDYATWARLTRHVGVEFAVIDMPTVAFRVTENYLQRRGGRRLLRSELELQRLLRRTLPKAMSPALRLARLAYTAAPAVARGIIARRVLTKSASDLPFRTLDEFITWPGHSEVFGILPHT